ncbi:acetolactate decarboxylase [Lacticaseibacillus daqingensis]|uniref:acetolactate decarboxylase n=1 Tax=Lacticaseibacillus daqingensis TaxID=2486014 RepID=UPI000F7B4B5C|nr:acetolactate decarboxylase [Lacticaseibacillus daqingensis]
MTVMYQHGTLANLVPGGFAGTLRLGDLLQHGDTGIGTLTGLDGELIILKGIVYQVTATGAVHQPDAQALVPFANVHPAAFDQVSALEVATSAAAKAAMAQALGSANLFGAVMLHGRFARMHTRAVAKQTPPYPTLTQTAAAQREFTATAITGTLMGYFSPALYAGMAAPGFHLHFLSDAHDFGGHVLDFAGVAGTLAVQSFADVQLHLPAEDLEFRQRDLGGADVVAQIQQAEGSAN